MKSNGFIGCDKLKKNDHIILFYTDNAKSIDIDIILNHGDAKFDMQKVAAGKQSLDMHLGSYLGYLIGKNRDKECKYIIISKDTDYDNVIAFWTEKEGVKIIRRPYISKKETKKALAGETAERLQLKPSVKFDMRKEINALADSQKPLKPLKKDIADIAVKHLGNITCTLNMLRMLETQKNVEGIVDALKPLLEKYNKLYIEQISEKAKVSLNDILSKADIPQEAIDFITQTTLENLGSPSYKTLLYSAIVNRYGPVPGKDYYALVKKILP